MRTGLGMCGRTAVIRICYKDFSAGTHHMAGLHGRVEHCTRGVTIYLLPGLTSWQRRAVIRRLRQDASRGFGPPLPRLQLAIALGCDRLRSAAVLVWAIVRLHPAVTLVPSAIVVVMATLFVVASAGQPGIAPGMRGGLAGTAAVSGSIARAVNARPSLSRVTRLSAAGGTGGTGADRAGLGSGQGAAAGQAHGGCPGGGPALRRPVHPDAWCVCLRAVTVATPRSRRGQLACRRPAPRAVAHTAHFPGPLDFAW
jgi:hypothetical protein